MTLRDEILSTKIVQRKKTVHWTYFNRDVLLVELTQLDIDRIAKMMIDPKTRQQREDLTAPKIIMSVRDPETEKPLFTRADLPWVSALPLSASGQIVQEIELLNSPITEGELDEFGKK
jgi:hypothetical protein